MLEPIRYDPFKILEKIGANAFRLDLPAYMKIYSVLNVENMRLYDPSLIEDPQEQGQLPSIEDLLPEYLNELQEDTVLDRRIRTSQRGNAEYLQVGHKGTNPSKARWIEIGKVREIYRHLLDN